MTLEPEDRLFAMILGETKDGEVPQPEEDQEEMKTAA